MNPQNLKISGDVLTDSATLERFSKDASSYQIQPALVVAPKNEDDILRTVEFASQEGLGLIPRGGGSGLSGAGLGSGIVLDTKKYLNQVLSVGDETVVQPGTILDSFNKQMLAQNRMLPSVPSSSALCTLGGNVGTRSTGPRSARYGTIDNFVSSLRFVTAGGEIVDTQEKLPIELESGIQQIQEGIENDVDSIKVIENRPYIAGGYNLNAFLKFKNPNEIITHLLVGSTGTLGVVAEIRLRLAEYRHSRGAFVAHFRDWNEFTEAALQLKALNPAALEFADATCSKFINGKIFNLTEPDLAATLIVEFDESMEQAQAGKAILKEYNLAGFWEFESGSQEEAALWTERKQILPSLWKYARQQKWLLPSIIDDIAIHLKNFGAVQKDLYNLMKELNHEVALFGHLGFGSIHARPFFDPQKGDLRDQIMLLSQATFKVLQKYHGTLVGEHNAGRSRSVYLEPELGPAYKYLKKVKELFDPKDILNPGIIFQTPPIYTNMNLEI